MEHPQIVIRKKQWHKNSYPHIHVDKERKEKKKQKKKRKVIIVIVVLYILVINIFCPVRGVHHKQAVGLSGAKTAIQVGGRTRIPDALTRTTLTEVKNVKSLSFTRQLRDFHTYSQQNGLDFILYTRPNTTLSGPLQQAINNGSIIHRFIP
jgi:hypothetical protein